MVMCLKPLRRHIQYFIDRHFYQHKYQAEQRLDDFAATLCQEVNLTRLSEGLIEVVSEETLLETLQKRRLNYTDNR